MWRKVKVKVFLFILHTSLCNAQVKHPYLLYVSFNTPIYKNLRLNHLQILNKFPYDGFAVQLISAYSDQKVNFEEFKNVIFLIKKYTNKHIWPWIFLNKIIGYDREHALNKNLNKFYFNQIKGMDTFNYAGALSDFYKIWITALELAKETDVPGIVVDLEAYNNYQTYKLSYLSKKLNVSEKEIAITLENIGRHLADLTNQVYPNATIIFFSCFFHRTTPPKRLLSAKEIETFIKPTTNFDKKFLEKFMSPTYICKGLLKRAKEKNFKFKVIDGGGGLPGYCNRDLAELKEKIKKRKKIFTPLLENFPNLELGGTIALYADINKIRGNFWLKHLKNSKVKNLEDFIPLLKCLFQRYNYIWIYGSKSLGYDEFNLKTVKYYRDIIQRSLKEAQR